MQGTTTESKASKLDLRAELDFTAAELEYALSGTLSCRLSMLTIRLASSAQRNVYLTGALVLSVVLMRCSYINLDLVRAQEENCMLRLELQSVRLMLGPDKQKDNKVTGKSRVRDVGVNDLEVIEELKRKLNRNAAKGPGV